MVENNQGTSVQQHGTGKLRTSDRSTPRFTIGVRIICFLVLVAVLAGGVVGFVVINTSLDSFRQSVLRQNLDQAELAAQFASNYMKVIQANARAFTARPIIIQAVLDNELERAQPELASFVKIQTVLNGAGIYDINGIQKAYSVADAVTVGQSFTDRDWFQQVVATSEPYQGMPVKSKGTGVPVSTYAIPILDGQGQIRAVVSFGISLGRLSDAIVNIDYGADTRTSMIDFRNGGFILADRDPQLLITPVSGKNEAVSRLLAGEHGAIETTGGSGELDLVGFAPVPDLTWGVMVITPSKTALAVAHALTQKASLITGLIILFAAILGGVFVLQITRPLLRLVEGTIEVGRGNLDYKVTTARRDEIGALSRAFGDMTEKLKNTLASRDNLYSVLMSVRNVNQLITHEKDKERLIQRSCDLLVEGHGYEKSWILLLDENRNPVSVASSGFGEEVSIFMEQLKTSNYTECLKELLSQEKQLLVYDRPGIRHKNCVLAGTHSTRGVFRCKLEYKGKLYGVLGVAISSTAVSDEEEQGLFLELAGDISFALANIESEEERKRIEKRLWDSMSNFYKVINDNADGIIVTNREGIVQFINPAAESFFGRKSEDFKGKQFDFPITLGGITEVNITRKAGDILVAEMRVAETVWYDKFAHLISLHDITERRRAEEKQQAIIKTALDGFWICNLEGKFLEVNESYCKMTGYTREELLEMSIQDVEAVESPEETARRIKRIVAQGSNRFETQHKRKDGKIIDIEISVNYFNIGEGQIFVFVRDITKRKQAEEALQASEIKYRRLFEAARDGLNAETGQVVDVNPFLIEMLGFSYEQFLGKRIWELGLLKDIIANRDNFIELQRKGYVRYEGLPLETTAGLRLEVEFVSNIYQVDHQKVIQCNIRDITERKKAEKAQASLSQQLQVKVSELEVFSHGIAHDLRSPLVSIEGFSRLLREDIQNQKVKNVQEDIRLLESGVRKMHSFLNSTLEYSRAGHAIKRSKDVSFRKIVDEVITEFAEQIKTIGVTVSIAKAFPNICVDRAMIIQVLTNLIQNSIKYRDKTVPLKIEIGHYLSGKEAVFFVRDNGLGIDASEAEKVFALFYRGTAEGEGSGIGLAVVKKVIEAHGGRIWVQQGQPGKGTTMCFTLPEQGGINKGETNGKN